MMRARPRGRSERITDGGFLGRMALAGGVTAGVCLGVFLVELRTGTIESARSMTFTALVFCELLKSFSFRSQFKPFWQLSILSNLQLPIVVAVSFAIQLMLHHVPFLSRLLKTEIPDWPQRWALLGLGLVPLMVLEFAKLARLASLRNRAAPSPIP